MTAADVERFRTAVALRFGLHFDDGKLGFLAEVLGRRLERTRSRVDAYLEQLGAGDAPNDELRSLAQELTVTETYFFRNNDQLRAFTDVVLATRARAPSSAPLRILSAGCASGEEAYTLAMLARAHLPEAMTATVSIVGIDVNVAMLEKARRARYSSWSLRETPSEARTRWFRARGGEFHVADEIRAMATFEERNLVEDATDLFRPGAFDVVLCRNVTMYFGRQTARAVMARLSSSLVEGGLLFLGHAETLRGLSNDFHLCHTHDTFYYQRRASLETTRAVEDPWTAPLASPSVSVPVPFDSASWVEAIQLSSDRIESLAGRPDVPSLPRSEARVAFPAKAQSVASVVDLLRQERFSEASTLLRSLPNESARDPDALLLQAVLLTHGGDLVQAEAVCATLLELDETSAPAHYVLALCRESAGDQRGATDQDQIAAYLDPTFAMPRLHLGLLARRAGDLDGARRELGQALTLLEREDASGVLLFGGGFSRDALIALCRAELSSCGGTS